MGGSSGGGSGPTLQQQQLETEQAKQTASLNIEENAQRKAILNGMFGTRVFRGSALSRAVRGDSFGDSSRVPDPASASQVNSYGQLIVPATASLVDGRESSVAGSGATPAGGAGGSGATGTVLGGRRGGAPAPRTGTA